MESYIKLSTLNDFIFCEKSIYYHTLYDNYNEILFDKTPQIEWKILHQSIDEKNILQRKIFYKA